MQFLHWMWISVVATEPQRSVCSVNVHNASHNITFHTLLLSVINIVLLTLFCLRFNTSAAEEKYPTVFFMEKNCDCKKKKKKI